MAVVGHFEDAAVVDQDHRQFHGPGKNGNVRGDPAAHHDQPGRVLGGKLDDVGGQQLAGDHDLPGIVRGDIHALEQVVEEAVADILDVLDLFLEQGVGVLGKHGHVQVHHLGHCPLRAFALADQLDHLPGKLAVLQHQQVGAEDQRRHVGQRLLELGLERFELLLAPGNRLVEFLQGAMPVLQLLGQFEVGIGAADHRSPPSGQPLGRGRPRKEIRCRLLVDQDLDRVSAGIEAHEELGILDGGGELGRDGLEGLAVGVGEVVALGILDRQHPHPGQAPHDGHRQERLVPLFPGFRNILVARA